MQFTLTTGILLKKLLQNLLKTNLGTLSLTDDEGCRSWPSSGIYQCVHMSKINMKTWLQKREITMLLPANKSDRICQRTWYTDIFKKSKPACDPI